MTPVKSFRFPFLFALAGSLACLALFYSPLPEDPVSLVIVLYPPILGIAVSAWCLARICGGDQPGLNRLRSTIATFASTVVGMIPFAWFMVAFANSKGMLIPPLGVILLAQCLVTTWAIGGLSAAWIEDRRTRLVTAYTLQLLAFLGVYLIMKKITNVYPLPMLGGNRVDAFSPITLYLQRFVHDRPVSRLHLMYVASLSIYACGCALLVAASFVGSRFKTARK